MQKEPTTEKSDVALREEAVLAFWAEHDIFNKSLVKDAPNGDYVFYDGPPFATGLPHYGHILQSTIKDAVPRFWTMNGYRVRRKWGWDCHGLPLENLIEKKLGLATKRDIEEYGVKNFNEQARTAIMEFADDWRQIIPRMGRWADMDDDYKTMDSTYTESVWWVFKQLYEKGLVFEGFKTMHLCPRCGTTLSNFEVNQGYKDIKDIAVTVKLPLLDEAGEVTDTSLLVWTTTPWTLPGNLAAAVNNEFTYAKVRVTIDEVEQFVILAKGRLSQLGTEEYEIISELSGSDLVGKKYEPPFSWMAEQDFEGKENAWQILHADYVELGEAGTGAVHIAPAFGDDDMVLAKEHGVPIVHHVNESGHFKDWVTDFAGQLVKPKDDDDSGVSHLDADIEVVKALKVAGKLLRKENITHSYPHCWRCDTPLLNYATTSWFVDVPSIKDKLVAENNKVQWVPEHVGTNRFGKWLEGARDWAVSRQRYWGAPLPIWRNPETTEYKVFGSLEELKKFVPKSGNTYFTMRHGESEKNVMKIVTDAVDKYPLTDKGRADITASLTGIDGFDLVISSPVLRAKQTAELVVETLGLAENQLIFDERIRELEHGVMEGKTLDEYRAEFPHSHQRFVNRPEGGEHWNDVRARVGEFLYELEENYQDKRILIVSHGDPLLLMHTTAVGLNEEQILSDREDHYPIKGDLRELPFTPLPHNDHYELDFHRPYIDDVVLEEDGVRLERAHDVFDCWFESGSMPYAETGYPYQNLHEGNPPEGVRFPADFIAESVDMTRGWFYSLLVISVALLGKAPFKNVVTNGLVLAEDGKKMSKKLQNYPDPMELVARQGADSMRFYLMSSAIIKAEDLSFSEKEVAELQRKNIGRLHNVLAMYEMYRTDTPAHGDSPQVLDRWIVSRLNQLIAESTAGYKNYELDKATRPINDFIDDLSVWYLRRSRDRLKQNPSVGPASALQDPAAPVNVSDNTSPSSASPRLESEDQLKNSEDREDKLLAEGTLRFVLRELAKVMAPVMPFYAEHLYRALRSNEEVESVHLTQWPTGGAVDAELLNDMHTVRDVVTAALEARTKAGIKVRQPVASVSGPALSEEYVPLVLEELNAKQYHEAAEVAVDTTITPELQQEGDARDFIRAVQDMRKAAGLTPNDLVTMNVQTSDGGQAIIEAFRAEITRTVCAADIVFGDATGTEVTAGEHSFTIEFKE